MKRTAVVAGVVATLLASVMAQTAGSHGTAESLSAGRSVLDGSWRKTVTKAEFRRAGLSEQSWNTNGGLHTLTFKNGKWLDHDQVVGNPPDGGGPFTIRGKVVTAIWNWVGGRSIKPVMLFRARFVRKGDTLRLTVLGGDKMAPVLWAGTWKRVG
jgi:hypothetical protein